jgi:hypothetical protein
VLATEQVIVLLVGELERERCTEGRAGLEGDLGLR